MEDTRTTQVVQQFLDELAELKGNTPDERSCGRFWPVAVDRLHLICTTLLLRSHPRLTRLPLNLQADEMLSAVVERLLKAMRQVHPPTVRQFFAGESATCAGSCMTWPDA